MGKVTLTGIGTIYTKGSSISASGKTLIISAHGRITGTSFTKAYPVVVQYASACYGALLAALKDAIDGKVTASEMAKTGPSEQDHAFAFFESDPDPAEIETALAKSDKFDVLTIDSSITSTRSPNSPTLSGVIAKLKQQGFLYPSTLGLHCRVEKEVATGKTLKSFDTTGAKHAYVSEHNEKQKNAVAIMQAIKAGGFKPAK